MSDAEERTRTLVEQASRGDGEAVHELLARNLPALRAYIRLRCSPALRARENVSDVAQSVCGEILDHAERFRFGDEAGFKAWLFTTAMRRIQNKDRFHRAAKRDVGREIPPGSDDGLLAAYRSLSSPSEQAIGREELERFEGAFRQLTDEQQEVVALSRIVGLSHDAIGEQLGKSAAAARAQLHRALADLAERLDLE